MTNKVKNYIKGLLFSVTLLGGMFLVFSEASADFLDPASSTPDVIEATPTALDKASSADKDKTDSSTENSNANANTNANTNNNNVIISNTNNNKQSQKLNVSVKIKESDIKKIVEKEMSKKTYVAKRVPATGSSTTGLIGLGAIASCISVLGIKRYFWKLA